MAYNDAAAKAAVKEFIEQTKTALDGMQEQQALISSRMDALDTKMLAEQKIIQEKISDVLDDAMQWHEVPENIDTEVKAALIYYAQSEPMALSHFKGDVLQDFLDRWNNVERLDDTIVEGVQDVLNKWQEGLMTLQQEQQKIVIEQQMNPPAYPVGVPLLKTLMVPPEKGETTWGVALIPFYVDENFEMKTEDLPYDYFVNAYIKDKGISKVFNATAGTQHVDPANGPLIMSFDPEDGNLDEMKIFLTGHIEQNGELVGPLTMPPQSIKGTPAVPPPSSGPALLN